MIDTTPLPSPLLKTGAILARWALSLVLAGWLVFGLAWGALHWLIVPRIGEFRPQLEAHASRVLGVPVRIGAIQAHSTGLIPSFELTQVQLFDGLGREALVLPRVLAALSPQSVLRLGFEQLYVERPDLNIRRTKDGRIYVAGLDFSKNQGDDNGAANWFFSQTEFAIHDGRIRWTDETREVPPLVLNQVELVVRNRGRKHALRLDATPPDLWGDRFTAMGVFTQPLLSRQKSQWQDWSGDLYTGFNRIDLSELRRYADLGVDLKQGRGAVRAWANVARGRLVGGTADVALAEVDVTLGKDLKALALDLVKGRLGAQQQANGFEFSTQGLAFDTRDGLRWPGGNVRVLHLAAGDKTPARGELTADRLDLAALSQIADRLPLGDDIRRTLAAHQPLGLVLRLQANWQGALQDLTQYEVKGAIQQLALAPVGDAPGIRGANLEFDLNQSGGKARIEMANGQVALPTFFAEPDIELADLLTEARWKIKGEHIEVELPNLKFRNADARGAAQIRWATSDPAKNSRHARFPGVLDLQATLTDVNGTRVHRYLPLAIQTSVRDYVRDAITAGTARQVKFLVNGDLHDIPSADPKLGDFKISAEVQNATLLYVPAALQTPGDFPWPALKQINGELLIDGMQLQVRRGQARTGALDVIKLSEISADINDLNHATVNVSAKARGPLSDVLGIVNGSPLNGMIGRALESAVASGVADYTLKLGLPIFNLNNSTVQGSVTLGGNDLQITPDTPKLSRARGVVAFSEKGFSVTGGQARMLGGDVRLEGGSVAPSGAIVQTQMTGPSVVLRASGTATAEGLRQAKELGLVAGLAQRASGSAAYTAVLGFRAGHPEVAVSSNLQGMALSFPAPLGKGADAMLPLRLETSLIRESLQPGPDGQVRLRDQLALDLGRLVNVVYQRDLGPSIPKVLRGSIGVGLASDESVVMPLNGVGANLNLATLDVDAWRTVLTQAFAVAGGAAASSGTPAHKDAALAYFPTSIAVRAQELTLGGRKLNQLVVGGSRDGALWRANLDARQLNGYLEYRQPSETEAGRVFARLSRLVIEPSAVNVVETLLGEQPASIPALDIVVDDFELRGKSLGRMEVEALNRGGDLSTREGGVREWRLSKFNVITPEARLTANGNWASTNAQSANPGRRRTVMNFKFDISDSGELLNRLGMKDVVRKGSGKMEGHVAWIGSPITLDYPSMNGAFSVNVENGQFLKADPGIAKLLGVLSLQSLPRRLTLDFRDVFSDGFAFDFLRGDVKIAQGIATTNNLQMKGVNAAVLMDGQANIARETQDLKVIVVPEINAGTASLIATVINPAVGLGTFLAQMFLRRPLIEAATQELHVDGSWTEPRVTKVERGANVKKEETQ
ncbi:YhdP family protein [Rhodoferax sp. PAMC 29310]|uniref:YhdP family protein n=1 Tax=Rhodoferax sp. PAMC 29310 TaxID=2822760 RepID=UPI001B318EA6|nr:YhdP family protein [Rhodoferax sp. PAMC 29310]